MAITAQIKYRSNPRYHADGILAYFGSSKDSALVYDGTNDEWTVQTKNAAGTLTDRLRLDANTDTPKLVLVATDLEGSDDAGPAIRDEPASSTNPTLVPRRDDDDTGIGRNGADQLSLIAGGAEIISVRNAAVNLLKDMNMVGSDLYIAGNFVEFTEMSAPGAGAANTVRVYAVVDGGSLTDLAAVFQDGTVDIFAQEVL